MSTVNTAQPEQLFKHKDIWSREGKDFLVQVSRHSVDPYSPELTGCSEGPHMWCVYAYIYPKHPHFRSFDGTEDMWQDAAREMPFHQGPSLCRKHLSADGVVTSYQVGADYNHLYDSGYTHLANADQAFGVFYDANHLFDWLAARTTGARDE